ncbi:MULTISPECIES: hypothetical protein [Sphingobacterium]|uniref:hypothetical protein n=1 Tax=Sphingobacterium TaxID=28453 RepID=UPI0013DD6B95|nr:MULTISPECIES: hypothetical protein [unclassified Sphingobacterium]
MKLIDRRSKIAKVFMSNGIYTVTDTMLNRYDIKGDISVIDDFTDIYERHSVIYVSKGERFYYLDQDDNKLFLLITVEANFIEPIDNRQTIVCKGSEDEVLQLYDGSVLIWSIPYSFAYFNLLDKNVLLLRDSFNTKQLIRIDLVTTKRIWHYTLPDGFKIFGSVQAIDDILFFSCTDANVSNSKIIGLSVKTGEMLWEFDNLVDFQIDYKHKLLRGYGGRYYQVIDPFEGKLLVNKDLKEYWDSGISPFAPNNTITDDKLWFVSGRGENAKFGALDLNTSEIDFIQDFPLEEDAQFDKPVYHEGKLYLRDSNNVLYVLE